MINKIQLFYVYKQLRRILNSNNFYKEKLKKKQIYYINNIIDFYKLPFTDKNDLQNCYPLEMSIVPEKKIVRIHSSSGTTQKPVIIPYTMKDIRDWSIMMERCYKFAQINKEDRIQVTPGYGMWTAGVGFQYGAEKLGAMVIPTGPGNTERQIQMMKDFKSTVLVSTSSYALLLAEKINEKNMKNKIMLKKGIIGSECWGNKMRKNIICGLNNIDIYDIYGLTEIYGPGIGISCKYNQGIHYWDDYIFIEIINPETLDNVPDGEWGEIVITTLKKEGAPLIRYRTHDISRIIPERCECGSGFSRIDTIKGRTDDMIKIKGVKFYPLEIEKIIEEEPKLLGEYQIHIFRKGGRDTVLLTVETNNINENKLKDKLVNTIKKKIGFLMAVKLVEKGDLPRSEKKSVRIIDERIL